MFKLIAIICCVIWIVVVISLIPQKAYCLTFKDLDSWRVYKEPNPLGNAVIVLLENPNQDNEPQFVALLIITNQMFVGVMCYAYFDKSIFVLKDVDNDVIENPNFENLLKKELIEQCGVNI